jgi:hypothetical protein
MQVRSEPLTPRPAAVPAFLPITPAKQSSPIAAFDDGLTAACAGMVVLAITATAVAAIAKRIKEFFLIDEFSVVSALEGEGWSENTGYGGQMKGF